MFFLELVRVTKNQNCKLSKLFVQFLQRLRYTLKNLYKFISKKNYKVLMVFIVPTFKQIKKSFKNFTSLHKGFLSFKHSIRNCKQCFKG